MDWQKTKGNFQMGKATTLQDFFEKAEKKRGVRKRKTIMVRSYLLVNSSCYRYCPDLNNGNKVTTFTENSSSPSNAVFSKF